MKIIISLVVLVGLAILAIVAIYPGSQDDAEVKFAEYLNKQGVDDNKISSKKIIKDYKNGGYGFIVTFEDDSAYSYEYFYNSNSKKIVLVVYDDGKSIDEGMKYEPIND
ncbi:MULTISPECIES: DUF3139 domain-containing protein [unclassified Psychrobacillus]|uniref:DUF3139 domain-containing protein n=1 Tax=unclassified Psychrobacillus TaxID=2636677 RepID=UPI001CD9B1F6|nr:DUF3139 domain-containing protein [Psychrobacillus sp. AK 1817]